MMERRVKRLRALIKERGIDGVIINNISNIRYLTGFTGSSAYLVITCKEGYFLTDPRYITQAKKEVRGFHIKEYKIPLKEIPLILEEINISTLGFEGDYLSFNTYKRLTEALSPKVSLLPLNDSIDDLRMKKETLEIHSIEKAADLASQALWKVIPLIKDGVKERDIAIEIDFQMKRFGADKASFDVIVISGERTALPHGRPSDKRIRKNELVMIDFGCVWKGYNSDETCTFCLGDFSEEQRKVYRVVKDAHDRAIDAIKPGVKALDIDSIAREVIEKAGYGGFFGHGTGHGVGLSIHEKPRISPYSDVRIEEGMVFTIEPAVYIPNWGGVRIEDTVVVTSDGCRILTKMPKDRNLLC